MESDCQPHLTGGLHMLRFSKNFGAGRNQKMLAIVGIKVV
jgi:hypothetical protein